MTQSLVELRLEAQARMPSSFNNPNRPANYISIGSINTQAYKGNIENLRTAKKPEQKIPTFAETMEWFNKPENQHLEFNVRNKCPLALLHTSLWSECSSLSSLFHGHFHSLILSPTTTPHVSLT